MRGGILLGWIWLGALGLGCGGAAGARLTAPEARDEPVAVPEPEPDLAPDFSKLEALARARDPEGVQLAARALGSAEPSLRLLAARALVGYGPAARDARAQLLHALSRESPGEAAGTMAWALVLLDAEQAARDVVGRLGDGSLQLARGLDGAPVFEVARLRRYAAHLKTDRAAYERYLVALGVTLGGAELVAELGLVSTEPQRAFFQQKAIFDVLSRLNDPGAADALVGFTQQGARPPRVLRDARGARPGERRRFARGAALGAPSDHGSAQSLQ